MSPGGEPAARGAGGEDQPGDSQGGQGGQAGEATGPAEPIDGFIPPTSEACAGATASSGVGHWRRLTTLQYKNTVNDLLGVNPDVSLFLSDTTTGRFLSNTVAATPDPQVLKYQDIAGTIAREAARDVAKLTGCAGSAQTDACALKFFNQFGARALRRPLSDDDRRMLDTVYRVGKLESFASGIRLTVEALLQSPSFLYLVETGTTPTGGVAAFDAYELASRLSYVFWNTMPDAELTGAAAGGELATSEGLAKQTERLMASPRFVETLGAFHDQLFRLDLLVRAGGVMRDVKRFPEWSAALASAMRDETRRFVGSVFTEGQGTLEELLTASYGFPKGPLLGFYGVAQPTSPDGKVTFTDGSRNGILTQPAILTAASPLDTKFRAVLRGKEVREEIFCEDLPSVPGNVVFKEIPGAADMTQQQLLRAHQENPTCSPCHELMDPLGFAFENYDAIGKHRTTAEDGRPVDTSGSVVGTDVEGAFANTAGLIEKLGKSHQVRSCFAEQWFKFALGRQPENADMCSLARTRDVLVTAGGNLREALTLLVTSDSFRYRGGL